MAHKQGRWFGAATRSLLKTLREREERRARWEDSSVTDVLVDMNAALAAALAYQEQTPAPQCIVMPYSSYMILTGHVQVKVGRRKRVWRKVDA